MADILSAQSGRTESSQEPAEQREPDAQRIYTEAERHERDRLNMIRALDAAGWRVSGANGAAALIGLKPSTFTDRMKKFGIAKPNPAAA
jgi:transcriptional regulator with GAF, ATPase, and Fis domain